MAIPKKLYKYCPVGIYSLRAISDAEIYHSSPLLFNDPLDCKPTINADIDSDQLIELLRVMSNEPPEEFEKTIDLLGWAAAGFQSQAPNEEEFSRALADRVLFHIGAEFGSKGVLSLSTGWNEPLMWSHYGDQHKGICIEYDTTNARFPDLKSVEYNASRSIRANDAYQWKVKNNKKAQERIFKTYFYAKAPQWAYEHEWRDVVDKAGVSRTNFLVSAIYFGIRCDTVWEKTIVKMLNRDRQIQLFRVNADDETFNLYSVEVDRDRIEKAKITAPAYEASKRIAEMLSGQNILSSIAGFGLQTTSNASNGEDLVGPNEPVLGRNMMEAYNTIKQGPAMPAALTGKPKRKAQF